MPPGTIKGSTNAAEEFANPFQRSNRQQNLDFSVLLLLVSSSQERMSWSAGDWMCGACQHSNFKRREACQLCGYPKFGGPDPSLYNANRIGVLPGDWYCMTIDCGVHNYASRSSCYRCGASKNNANDSSFPPGWKEGDWICARVGCKVHNYACRMECFKCKTPKQFGA